VLAVWLDGQHLSLVHVGDSRAYLLRAGVLEQLTVDHSLAAERARRGFLTQQQADTSALQSILLRALGTDEEVEVDANEHPLVDGDAVLLCTDGLTRMVPRPEIASTLITCPSAQAGADRLVALASHHGGKDNVTVVVLRIELGGDSVLGRLRRWLRGSGGLPDAASSAGGR
jgi:protein phosphatase